MKLFGDVYLSFKFLTSKCKKSLVNYIKMTLLIKLNSNRNGRPVFIYFERYNKYKNACDFQN